LLDHWSRGAPVETVRAAIKNPELPGKTSDLAIGEEPRRGANAAIVQAEFLALVAGIRADPYTPIFLTNTHPNFDAIEYGSYSLDSGKKSRTPPGGMTRRGETKVKYALGSLANVL
jgi:hypothetical protein